MNKLIMLTIMAIVSSGMALGFTNPCPNSTSPSQCAVVDAASAPPFVADTLIAQGAVPDSQCGDLLILSSGLPLDGDTLLSEPLGMPGCGTNPDGYDTYDCVQLFGFSPDANSVILAISSEWPEYEGTTFTDWMQIGGIVDQSINDWVGEPSLVDMPGYAPDASGSVTLATLAASQAVDLRIADSGDEYYDTAMIIVPVSCFENLEDPVLCGNGEVEQGEECDDGNNDDGDGCSSICLLEPEPFCGDGIVNQPAEACDGTTEVTCSDFGYDFGQVWCNDECLLEDDCYNDEVPNPFCGDGAVNQPGEQCDDGNYVNGDGCDEFCQLEPVGPFCGDGFVDANEQCDDGNYVNGDGCDEFCQDEVPPQNDIPEFTVIGAGLALLGAGFLVLRKKRN